MKFTGYYQLDYYDAIAPIVSADSIDMSVAFKAARYDKGGDDYINCPMNKEQYETFINELLNAKSVPLKRFEETRWFESCLPIEEIARRGVDRKSTRLNSSHLVISYAVFCLKKKKAK